VLALAYHQGTTINQGRNEVRWQPQVRTCALSEAKLLYWRMYLWHFWDFGRPRSDSAPSEAIQLPIVIRRPGNCVPFPPLLRSCNWSLPLRTLLHIIYAQTYGKWHSFLLFLNYVHNLRQPYVSRFSLTSSKTIKVFSVCLCPLVVKRKLFQSSAFFKSVKPQPWYFKIVLWYW